MKPSLTVVSLGPGSPDLLTRQTEQALRSAEHLILRTAQHPLSAWLAEQRIGYTTLDDLYDAYEDFDEMHRAMAERLWAEAGRHPLIFAVMDATADGAVRALRAGKPEQGTLTILPGIGAGTAALSRVPDPSASSGAVRVLPAMEALDASPDPLVPLLVTELDKPELAAMVKLALSGIYGDEAEGYLLESTVSGKGRTLHIPLYQLDRQKVYDHTVALYLPPMPYTERERFCLRDLMDVMERLRGPGGCAWDAEQTHQTLRKFLLEEAYEAAGAIDEEDPDHLAEELGDVLLQVVFHASIGKACGEFDMGDITTAITEKMIRRHPWVFPRPGEENATWESLKMEERGTDTVSAMMADVSAALPAMTRAAKVQSKAARTGFTWPDALSALPKVEEEAQEVREELAAGRDPEEEWGDLLFACVNGIRLSGLEPEQVLEKSTQKFIRRFSELENLLKMREKSLKDLTLREMVVYWNTVKSAETQRSTSSGVKSVLPEEGSHPADGRNIKGGIPHEQV